MAKYKVPVDLQKKDKIWFGKLDQAQGIWVFGGILFSLVIAFILQLIFNPYVSIIWLIVATFVIYFLAFHHKKGFEDISILQYLKYKKENSRKTKYLLNEREDIARNYPKGVKPEELDSFYDIFSYKNSHKIN